MIIKFLQYNKQQFFEKKESDANKPSQYNETQKSKWENIIQVKKIRN